MCKGGYDPFDRLREGDPVPQIFYDRVASQMHLMRVRTLLDLAADTARQLFARKTRRAYRVTEDASILRVNHAAIRAILGYRISLEGGKSFREEFKWGRKKQGKDEQIR